MWYWSSGKWRRMNTYLGEFSADLLHFGCENGWDHTGESAGRKGAGAWALEPLTLIAGEKKTGQQRSMDEWLAREEAKQEWAVSRSVPRDRSCYSRAKGIEDWEPSIGFSRVESQVTRQECGGGRWLKEVQKRVRREESECKQLMERILLQRRVGGMELERKMSPEKYFLSFLFFKMGEMAVVRISQHPAHHTYSISICWTEMSRSKDKTWTNMSQTWMMSNKWSEKNFQRFL